MFLIVLSLLLIIAGLAGMLTHFYLKLQTLQEQISWTNREIALTQKQFYQSEMDLKRDIKRLDWEAERSLNSHKLALQALQIIAPTLDALHEKTLPRS